MEWNSPAEAERFVADYANAILRLCTTYSLTREDAQDICQEIFLKLLEQNKTFEDREHEKAYILKMAINACKTAEERGTAAGGPDGRGRTDTGP